MDNDRTNTEENDQQRYSDTKLRLTDKINVQPLRNQFQHDRFTCLNTQYRHTAETKDRLEDDTAYKDGRKHTDGNTDCQGHGKAFDWPCTKLKEHNCRHDGGGVGVKNCGERPIKPRLHRGAG